MSAYEQRLERWAWDRSDPWYHALLEAKWSGDTEASDILRCEFAWWRDPRAGLSELRSGSNQR